MGDVPNETSYYEQDEKLAVSELIENHRMQNNNSSDNLQEELAMVGMDEERKLDMMISGGDYSPNSHTFFKHPFKGSQQQI
jgi:hypothetical protein